MGRHNERIANAEKIGIKYKNSKVVTPYNENDKQSSIMCNSSIVDAAEMKKLNNSLESKGPADTTYNNE